MRQKECSKQDFLILRSETSGSVVRAIGAGRQSISDKKQIEILAFWITYFNPRQNSYSWEWFSTSEIPHPYKLKMIHEVN